VLFSFVDASRVRIVLFRCSYNPLHGLFCGFDLSSFSPTAMIARRAFGMTRRGFRSPFAPSVPPLALALLPQLRLMVYPKPRFITPPTLFHRFPVQGLNWVIPLVPCTASHPFFRSAGVFLGLSFFFSCFEARRSLSFRFRLLACLSGRALFLSGFRLSYSPFFAPPLFFLPFFLPRTPPWRSALTWW